MSDKKNPNNFDKASLKNLTGLSSMDELREQMAALIRPSYLTDLQAQMAQLTRPSYLKDLQAQMVQLMRPSHLADMQAQMAQLTRPSHLADLQAQMTQLTRPSYLADLQVQMAQLTQPSYLKDIQAQMAQLTRPSYLAELREQMAGLTQPLRLAELQGPVAAMASRARMRAELAAAVGSYRELISGSELASYLVSPDDDEESQVMRVERFDSLEVGDFALLEVDPIRSVDLEIVKAISEGEVAKLSPTAMQRLHSVYLQIVVVWDMLLRIFNTFVALGVLTALMTGASAPADVPVRTALLTNEQRVLLADYRIVNRNGARLRAEPSKKAEIIVSLELGVPVEVLESNGKGWFRVIAEYQDESVEGWIHLTVTTPVPPPTRSKGLVAAADPGVKAP
ncbi:SH3 domain-containing protein [Stutzerimonas nosocomialis]|uniref:SH3 domain-containing protein n=1 Tax=Stutzerimonas nosocomialis TaxID=1056496 RepID=UPI00110998A6|nr:SH3 domain-containing protein [Stutzerimonas nosocomialis]